MRTRSSLSTMAGVVSLLAVFAPVRGGAGERWGDLEFPRDEHAHVDGWDFWWGGADVVTTSGSRYIVGIAFDTLHGVGVTGHELFPLQGPYEGRSIMSMDGPKEWGHEGETLGRFQRLASVHDPLVERPPIYQTFDLLDGLEDIGHWERTSLDAWEYHLRVDAEEAWVHPTGEKVRMVVDLRPEMKSPPLLAGGTGTWWYGIPPTFGYPSRSYQYVQGAHTVAGTITLEQPDGSILVETVDSTVSRMVMIREYDASPEDLYVGLGLAMGTQLHPSFPQYYHGGMPWDLIFLDLGNGAQLMLAVLAFHETDQSLLARIVAPEMPTYGVLATVRLPDGRSVALDDALEVEHLSYKTIIGRVPTFWVAIHGIWRQAWDYRVRFDGGSFPGPDGAAVEVPAFDLGLEPIFALDEPAVNGAGDGPTQRIPFAASGSWDGCPVNGFAWSELIINWYGNEHRDPWFTGGKLPGIPEACGAEPGPERDPGPGDPSLGGPPSDNPGTGESCMAYEPGAPSCEYVATSDAGIAGFGPEPGSWTVTIERPGVADPIVIPSLGGFQTYQCGTVVPGDRVVAEAEPGAGVSVGNPGFCFESAGGDVGVALQMGNAPLVDALRRPLTALSESRS